jgi:hypothetical protein
MQFLLVNCSKREVISFEHLTGAKKRELTGSPAQSAIVTWYMLTNIGDNIQFVSDSDSDDDWPFNVYSKSDLIHFKEMTNELVDRLVSEEILKDFGKSYVDDDEPEKVFIRDLRNVWAT